MACGADKRFASQVFLRAGLFADQHCLRVGRSFAEYGMGGIAPQRAVPTSRCLVAQCRQAARRHVVDGFRQRNHGTVGSVSGIRPATTAPG